MNERIRKLEQQALSIVMNGDDPDGDVDKMYIPSEFTKKFALLLVEECAQRAKAYAYISPNFTALAEELRRMIGVEE